MAHITNPSKSYIFWQFNSLGVADGVGEWQWRFGLDPRAFADELMLGSPDGHGWWLVIGDWKSLVVS